MAKPHCSPPDWVSRNWEGHIEVSLGKTSVWNQKRQSPIRDVLDVIDEIIADEHRTMREYATGNDWPLGVGERRSHRSYKLRQIRPEFVSALIASRLFTLLESEAFADHILAVVNELQSWSDPIASWAQGQRIDRFRRKKKQHSKELNPLEKARNSRLRGIGIRERAALKEVVEVCLPRYSAAQDKLHAIRRTLSHAVGRPKDPLFCEPIEFRDGTVYVRGKPVPFDCTNPKLKDLTCFLKHIIAARGTWMSGSDIARAEKELTGKDVRGFRWDRIRRALPETVSQYIESNRRMGYRIKP